MSNVNLNLKFPIPLDAVRLNVVVQNGHSLKEHLSLVLDKYCI